METNLPNICIFPTDVCLRSTIMHKKTDIHKDVREVGFLSPKPVWLTRSSGDGNRNGRGLPDGLEDVVEELLRRRLVQVESNLLEKLLFP